MFKSIMTRKEHPLSLTSTRVPISKCLLFISFYFDEHEREKSELHLEIEIHYFFRNKIKVGGKTFSKKNPLNSGFQKKLGI